MTTQLQFFLIAVAGRMNRHQQAAIEDLQEENRVLLEQLGRTPKHFTDARRMRLARRATAVGRHRLGQLSTIVTPDTLLRWLRVLIAKRWTYARTDPLSRPPVDPELEKLVLKLIEQNPTWGSNRIVGALDNLGYTLSDLSRVATSQHWRRALGRTAFPVPGRYLAGRRTPHRDRD